MGPFIAAGFAGSVRFGFWAVDDLRNILRPRERDGAWVPQRVAWKWHRRARRKFRSYPEEERRLSAAVMLIGVSPDKDMGIPGWARPSVALMRSPDFTPSFLGINQVKAIGSGSTIERLNAILEKLEESTWERLELEGAMPGASAEAFRDAVLRVLLDNPQVTVSSHVHLCVVRRGSVEITPSDFIVVDAEGGEWWLPHAQVQSDLGRAGLPNSRQITMPPVAASWREFEVMWGLEATAASC